MSVDAAIRFADGPDREVFGPTPELGVDPPCLFVDLQTSRPTRRQLMDPRQCRDSSHILISRNMRPSLIRRETDFINSACGMLSK